MKFKQLFAWSALLTAVSFSSLAEVSVEQPQVREMPPGVPNTAAYMVLTSQDSDTALIGADCDIAGRTEIHTMFTENGLMKMRRIEKITLPKGEQITLHQGRDHLMLLQLTKQPLAGETVTCELHFDGQKSQQVKLPIVNLNEHAHHHHH
ncbi:copper chaperone PCu(A)C [Ferrimonas aestuarii]|uniref:Copper chaperone PCu(A)C n=1 Tax=Ferrimonas aestuarii TaxID=2569539 RepID=A0A4U1BRJ0_9GAMM|nr:copper chaperone PCu(A)C [Ferrimonas aestuarii]TKB56815.1 copper chaperone PCu(A)C [Ferrimonas aestuarii]